jgi:hypothetical protein
MVYLVLNWFRIAGQKWSAKYWVSDYCTQCIYCTNWIKIRVVFIFRTQSSDFLILKSVYRVRKILTRIEDLFPEITDPGPTFIS